jgi:hypothetical protein
MEGAETLVILLAQPEDYGGSVPGIGVLIWLEQILPDPRDRKGFARTLTTSLLWITSQSTLSDLIGLRIMDTGIPFPFTIRMVVNSRRR